MSTPPVSDAELVRRYRANYGLSGDSPEPTADQMRFHLELERELTRQLLVTTRENRWETFERCYNELYSALPWLTSTGSIPEGDVWSQLIGPAPQRVYEIGSGAGGLAIELANRGYDVTATDISRERGGNHVTLPRLQWTVTDGVNLDRFAGSGVYDAVISDQVIEHLHPDDLQTHLAAAHRILSPHGQYIFRTPHAYTGPHDISRVFGLAEPVGMHLHEYTNRDLLGPLRIAGFQSVRAVLSVPRFRQGGTRRATASRALMLYLLVFEMALGRLPRGMRRAIATRLRGPLKPTLFLAAS